AGGRRHRGRTIHRRAVRLRARERRRHSRYRHLRRNAAPSARERTVSPLQNPRVQIGLGILILGVAAVAVWLWLTAGRQSTDDAQIDGYVTQVAARVGGTITKVLVNDNQLVEAGTVLVELDPLDYQVALDKTRAELADAEANAVAAQSNVPITTTTAASTVTTAR